VLDVIEVKYLKHSAEGAAYAQNGTPEYQYAMAAPFDQEVPKATVEEKVGKEFAKIGFAKAMQKKWVQLCGAQKENVKRIVKDAELIDEDRTLLLAIQANPDPEKHDKKVIDNLKKRQLLNLVSKKSYRVTKGPNYLPQRQKLETQLTADMLRSGSWKETQFKRYNLNAVGQAPQGGHFHPLLKVRAQFRQILLEMGFNEMPTQRYVESSFWNFDSLF
jgi:phenylalanyl-tRNA synthetase alpha chain